MAIFYQQNNAEQWLFTKQKKSLLAYFFALSISLGTMFIDAHDASLRVVHRILSTLLSPLQFAADVPFHVIDKLSGYLRHQNDLLNENNVLHEQKLLLEAKLQTLSFIHHENIHLKRMLAASTATSLTQRVMLANILEVEINRARQLLVLNKGTRDGVRTGLPVFDASGVMGQIIDVGLMTSTVLLISDSKCAVPVRDERTGERAILVGSNNTAHLSLIHLPKTSLIKVGDHLVTSGLGHNYPEGFPVGIVEDVSSTPGDDFIQVRVHPDALLSRNRLVLLRWPEEETDELMAQIHARLRVLEGVA